MNVLLPASPSGAKGVPGAGEGPQGRHDVPDGDFAAALAETAGEAGEDGRGDESKVQRADDSGPFSRATRRLGARELREANKQQETEFSVRSDETSGEIVKELRAVLARHGGGKAQAKLASASETQERGEAPPIPASPEPNPAADAVREVLAALGIDFSARPETTAAPEVAVAVLVRKGSGPRGPDMNALGSEKADMPELGDETQEPVEIIPVQVVRQEKHFQAAGVEARRWQIAQDAFSEARAMMPADAAKLAQAGASARERPALPAALARATEAMTQVAAPVSPPAVIEVMPGAVGIQIADRLQQVIGPPTEAGAPATAGMGFEPDTRQTFAPAIRTIKLQLNPAELGAVTIVVSGNEEGLRVELAAELADTVTKVDSDRGILAARLNGAGYTVNDISVARSAGQSMDGDSRDQGGRHGNLQEQFAGNSGRDGGAQYSGQHGGRQPSPSQAGVEMWSGTPHGAAPGHVVAGVSYAGRFRPV